MSGTSKILAVKLDGNIRDLQNFTVAEYSTAVQAGTADPEKAQKIDELVESLKREGLLKDIILIAAEDSQLNARVIVDGNSRAVALAVRSEKDTLQVFAVNVR